MTNSHTLLAEYVRNGTESAFRELVARYIDLVYSTALRQVGDDTHLAEDVAQEVFLCLAKKARTLPGNVMLGGWLHQTTRKVASTLMRGEHRRQVREREAVQMHVLQNESSGDLERIAPMIDDAIGQLPDEDRTAVLLRFFEKRDFRSVGEALGSSEDAARMRVNRALEKLEVILKQRGVTISATALGAALAAEAVTAAPTALAATVAGSALAGVAVTSAATLSVFKIMTLSKVQIGVVSAVTIAGLSAALLVQHQSLERLRAENRSLQQQTHDLSATKDQLAKYQMQQRELEQLRRDQSELLRLRSEVTVLRRAAKPVALQSLPDDRS
ncbi:MAG TPA: sigma-70 family RNA polymerase sigma factor, partial [Clostridia bacterium]|nr:sigma-70 family RNA polymerase sigma factor [Clostridia bacterium]